MAQAKVTLNEIITAVRELTFDRFIIPAFAIKHIGEGYVVSIVPAEKGYDPTDENNDPKDGGYLEIKNTIAETTVEPIVLNFSEFQTMESLMNELIAQEIIVAYTPYFRGSELTSSLIKVTDRSLAKEEDNFTAYRRYFFSDEEIISMICWYYWRVLDIPNVELTDEIIAKLQRPSEKHMAIWVSYWLVDKRRLYEQAANAIGQSFTDGSDYVGSSDTGAGTTTTVNIGSVFSITEDPSEGYFIEDFNSVGSDNIWGDRYSFWYRLMLYLRDLLETQFGDYSLRKDNVIPGYISLQRELDFRSYFDSYPFTLSPLSRGILSKTP